MRRQRIAFVRPRIHPFVYGVALAFAATAAQALTPAEIVTPELVAEPVTVTSLHDDELAFFDAERKLRREPAGTFVRLRFHAENPDDSATRPDGSRAMLTLTDGQRLTGEWKGVLDGGQTLVWAHPVLGELRLPLDRIASTRFDLLPRPQATVLPDGTVTVTMDLPRTLDLAPAAQDRVVLSNGDALLGFVPSLGEAGDGVSIETDGQTLAVPLDRVRAIVLSNPTIAPPAIAGQHLVYLRDGSRFLARDLSITRDRVTLVPAILGRSGTLDLPLDDLAGIDFAGSGWRVVDLAELPMTLRSGGEVFGLSAPPAWDAGMLRAHAPSTVTFTLPAGAMRFAGTAELDLDAVPADLRDWADLLVTVTDAGDPAEPLGLSAKRPSGEINMPIAEGAAELTVTIDEGVNGPILDRVRLRGGVILTRGPVAESADGSAGER